MKKKLTNVEKDIYGQNNITIPFDFHRFVLDNQVESSVYLAGSPMIVQDILSKKEEIDELTE